MCFRAQAMTHGLIASALLASTLVASVLVTSDHMLVLAPRVEPIDKT